MKNPTDFAGYVFGLVDELHKPGRNMIKESLEAIDKMLQESPVRKKKWIMEAHHSKTLTTYPGDVTFQKTLFRNKETKEASYLPDRILELEPNQRLTEDAAAEMLKEAVQTIYRRSGEKTSLAAQVSRETVKNKIHPLEFPPDSCGPEKKKTVDYLYIDADEDNVALQFQEKREIL